MLYEVITVIKQKNKVLTEMKSGNNSGADIISVYNTKITETGSGMYDKRIKFIQDFLPYFSEIFKFISDGLYTGDIRYETQRNNFV